MYRHYGHIFIEKYKMEGTKFLIMVTKSEIGKAEGD